MGGWGDLLGKAQEAAGRGPQDLGKDAQRPHCSSLARSRSAHHGLPCFPSLQTLPRPAPCTALLLVGFVHLRRDGAFLPPSSTTSGDQAAVCDHEDTGQDPAMPNPDLGLPSLQDHEKYACVCSHSVSGSALQRPN